MNFKKSKRYSNFNYTPRFYDEEKIHWSLRKEEIKNKVLKENYSHKDFINLRTTSTTAKIRKFVILGGIIGIIIAVPVIYGAGLYQLCIMTLAASGFIKMSNILSK